MAKRAARQRITKRPRKATDPTTFKSEYAAVCALIEAKVKKHEPIEVTEEASEERSAKVIDLVEALKKSVKRDNRRSGSTATRRKKAG